MKRAYYFIFYKIYSFFKSISDDGWADWKAFVIIGSSQMLLFIELLIWYTIIFRTSININKPKYIVIPITIFLAIANYYILLHKERWREYENEFKTHSKTKSLLAGWVVFLVLACVLGSLIFAFYQMSLIDWKKYR